MHTPWGRQLGFPRVRQFPPHRNVGDRHVRVGFSATDPLSGRFRGPCKSPQLAQVLLGDIGLISLHLLYPRPNVVGRQETGDLVMVFVVVVVWRWEEGSKQSAVWASPCQPRGPRLTGSGFTKEVLTISGGLHNAKPHSLETAQGCRAGLDLRLRITGSHMKSLSLNKV